MKNKLRAIIGAEALLGLSGFSFGNCYMNSCYSNFYIAGAGSVVWLNDLNLTFDDFSSASIDYKTGGGASAAMGYVFDVCSPCPWDIRVEAEVVYRMNSFKDLRVTFLGDTESTRIHGHNQNTAIMGNVIMDSAVMSDVSFYLGGGMGVAFNQMKFELDDDGSSKHNETLFAWQILAGASLRLCPHLFLTVGYRFFATTKSAFDVADLFRVSPKHIPMTQSVDIGLRLRI